MAMKLRVCESSALAHGEMREFDFPGISHPILIARDGENLYASNGYCPHEDVSLVNGSLRGTVVACPGHGYRFDLTNGRCKHDPLLKLPMYRVTVEDGWIFVELISTLSEPT